MSITRDTCCKSKLCLLGIAYTWTISRDIWLLQVILLNQILYVLLQWPATFKSCALEPGICIHCYQIEDKTAGDMLADVTVLKTAYAAPSPICIAYVLALEAEESCIGLRLQTHTLVCELAAQSAQALHTLPCSPPRTSGSLLELAATAAHLIAFVFASCSACIHTFIDSMPCCAANMCPN